MSGTSTLGLLTFHPTDVLYLKFGREIESFNDSLLQLEAVIKHANDQRPLRPWRTRDDECRVALHPVAQAVGDFKKTLEECKKLLDDHERFERDEAGFVDNVLWHVSTQRDVEILRERVHFHSTKVNATSIDLINFIVLIGTVTCHHQTI